MFSNGLNWVGRFSFFAGILLGARGDTRGRAGGVRQELAPRGAVRATGPPLEKPRAVSNPIQTRTHDRIRLTHTGRPSSSTPDFERPRALAYFGWQV
jgi:hypothetical protein